MALVQLHHCSASCLQAKLQQLGLSFAQKAKGLATIGELYLCKCPDVPAIDRCQP